MEHNPSGDTVMNFISTCDADEKNAKTTLDVEQEQDKENLIPTRTTKVEENTNNNLASAKDPTSPIAEAGKLSVVEGNANVDNISGSEKDNLEMEGIDNIDKGMDNGDVLRKEKKRKKRKAYMERYKQRKLEGKAPERIETKELSPTSNLAGHTWVYGGQLNLDTGRVAPTAEGDTVIHGLGPFSKLPAKVLTLECPKEMQVAVVPSGATELLSQQDVKELRKSLIKDVREAALNTSSPELHFETSGWMNPGWFVVSCSDEISRDWLLNWKPEEISGMSFQVLKFTKLEQLHKITFALEIEEKQDIANILELLQCQNRKLQTTQWESLGMKKIDDEFVFTFAVDDNSATALRECGWKLYFELSSLTVEQLECGTVFSPSK